MSLSFNWKSFAIKTTVQCTYVVIAVGIWYIMWSNVGNIGGHKSSLDFMPASRRDSINSSVSQDDNTNKPNAFLVSLFFNIQSCLTMFA